MLKNLKLIRAYFRAASLNPAVRKGYLWAMRGYLLGHFSVKDLYERKYLLSQEPIPQDWNLYWLRAEYPVLNYPDQRQRFVRGIDRALKEIMPDVQPRKQLRKLPVTDLNKETETHE